MSEATKWKLSKWIKDPFVRDMLDKFGLSLPIQIRKASDEDLARAGLTQDEINEVRRNLPAIESE